jgi:hypothetical protein
MESAFQSNRKTGKLTRRVDCQDSSTCYHPSDFSILKLNPDLFLNISALYRVYPGLMSNISKSII